MKTLRRLFAALFNKSKKEKKQTADLARIALTDNIDEVLAQALAEQNTNKLSSRLSYWLFWKKYYNIFIELTMTLCGFAVFMLSSLLLGALNKEMESIVKTLIPILSIFPPTMISIFAFIDYKKINKKQLFQAISFELMPPENKAQLIVNRFKKILDEHRRKVVGADTDFGKILERAELDRIEAQKSVNYWEKRLASTADNQPELAETIQHQLDVAKGTLNRTEAVISRLNQQKATLLSQFGKLETRLPEISDTVTDHFESKKLENLVKRVEKTEYEAQQVSLKIFTGFAREMAELQQSANMLGVISHQALAQGPINLPLLEDMAQKIENGRAEGEQLREKVLQIA